MFGSNKCLSFSIVLQIKLYNCSSHDCIYQPGNIGKQHWLCKQSSSNHSFSSLYCWLIVGRQNQLGNSPWRLSYFSWWGFLTKLCKAERKKWKKTNNINFYFERQTKFHGLHFKKKSLLTIESKPEDNQNMHCNEQRGNK